MQTPDVIRANGLSIAETLTKLETGANMGLSDAQVHARLKTYGPNALIEKQV